MIKLGDLDRHIVAVILGLSNRASGYDIRRILKEEAGREVSVGALYTTLDRLVNKGALLYDVAEGDVERGGRPQRFFMVTPLGDKAIRAAYASDNAVYKFAGLQCRGGF